MNPPLSEQPTRMAIRNILGVPPDEDLIFDTLTHEQRLGLALSRVAEDIDAMQAHGCEIGKSNIARLGKLEAWYYKMVGVFAACGGFVTLIFLLIGILRYLKNGGST